MILPVGDFYTFFLNVFVMIDLIIF